jgi:hypothetical protein
MSDAELIAWLESGAKPSLSADDEIARRRSGFSARFGVALKETDLGPTEEAHQAAVARLVYGIHMELNKFGELEYSAVWSTLPAGMRSALKTYISMGKKLSTSASPP